jgi:hypothetical protein
MPAVKVFMSYRRVDNPFLAGRLKDELGRVFGDENVFYDVDSIRAGSDFREVIRETLASVDAVIALVGSDWDAARLVASNDPVRTELREALKKKKLLIPVLVGNTVMPAPEQLPDDLRTFAFLNAVRVRPDPDFENDAQHLIREITGGVAGVGATGGEDATGEGAGGHTVEEGAGGETIDTGKEDRGGLLAWFTGKRLVFIGAGLVAAIVLAIVLGSLDDNKNNGGSASPTSLPTPRTAPVVVDGATAWTDTGFDVAPGDRIQVQATGLVFHDRDHSIGPDGERGLVGFDGPLGSDHHSGLIGRISDTGAPFLVGERVDRTAEQAGRLFLGINDVGLDNNSGAFDATVMVTPVDG